MDKIIYNGRTFGEGQIKILSGRLTRSVSAVGEELAIDEFVFVIHVESGETFLHYTYGEPVIFNHDNRLSKFYIRRIRRIARLDYEFSCISAVGLLDNIQHFGGLWVNGAPFRTICADIMGATLTDQDDNYYYYQSVVPYSISREVGNITCYQYLPIGSARHNLGILLLSVGADVFRDENLDMSIRFNRVNDPEEIVDADNYINGQEIYLAPATQINVTEHSFLTLPEDEAVTLFDNLVDATGAVNGKVVTFAEPCHDLAVSGALTIDDSGVNYAVVTGTGVLTGKRYTHVTKLLEYPTGIEGEENIISVNPDYTMISAANSENVARRVASYCTSAQEMVVDFVDRGLFAGEYIEFASPYGEKIRGIIKSMNTLVSGILKSSATIECGWLPEDFGNTYNNYTEFDEDGTFAVPAGTKSVMIVLVGGGHGGAGGKSGIRGKEYQYEEGLDFGKGGDAGRRGDGGRILSQIIETEGGETITFTIGEGGEGGESDEEGEEGGETTATINGEGYTSADGAASPTGFTNFMTGETVALAGVDGIAGGDGNPNGGSIIYNGVEYLPGGNASDLKYNRTNYRWDGTAEPVTVTSKGGYGGGAAVGANGEHGGYGSVENFGSQPGYSTYWIPSGGDGGAGATATISPNDSTKIAGGGHGGFGGGGGGQMAFQDFAHTGAGGRGSKGSKGGRGRAYVFY